MGKFALIAIVVLLGLDVSVAQEAAPGTPSPPRSTSGQRIPGNDEQIPLFSTEDWIDTHMRPTSIIQLIAVPDHYHEKQIRIEGYLVVERENNAVYLSYDDARHMITANAIWISFEGAKHRLMNQEIKLAYKEISDRYGGRYVSLVGTYDAKHKGNHDTFAGTVRDVVAIYGLTARKDLAPP
jgi:hypothetical protein